ncbi:MAG: hypothetical protein Q7S27_07280 [Nanoarchaeota archaeon]|nr:hypothetical protein [Nanoarchaeota archaeon]
MEKVTITREEYEELRRKAIILEKLEELDLDFIRQVLASKEDLKHGRFKVLA